MMLHHQQLRVLALRKACALTQIQLSSAMDVNQGTVSRWEVKGTINSKHMEQLLAMAHDAEIARGPLPFLASIAELALRASDIIDAREFDAQALKVCADRVLAQLSN